MLMLFHAGEPILISFIAFTGRARDIVGDRKQNLGLSTTSTVTTQLMSSIGVGMIGRTLQLEAISLAGRLFPSLFW